MEGRPKMTEILSLTGSYILGSYMRVFTVSVVMQTSVSD